MPGKQHSDQPDLFMQDDLFADSSSDPVNSPAEQTDTVTSPISSASDLANSLDNPTSAPSDPANSLVSPEYGFPDQASVSDVLALWTETGAIRPLDKAFADFIASQSPDSDPLILITAALTCERNGHGHICLDLQRALQHPGELLSGMDQQAPQAAVIRQQVRHYLPDQLSDWIQQLAAHPAVLNSLSYQADSYDSAAEGDQPLILSGHPDRPLLYLRRYRDYEQRIMQGVRSRLQNAQQQQSEKQQPDKRQQDQAISADMMAEVLDALFPSSAHTGDQPDWQKVACAISARSGFSVITGGPGTGKTTTVVKLLALLQTLQLKQGLMPLRIRLAAPTGKAAARLNESIRGKLAHNTPEFSLQGLLEGNDLPTELQSLSAEQREHQLRHAIPSDVTTLHRLLGARPDSRYFRHNGSNLLPADLVVVDEASMVDIEMMAQLMDALRPDARLILLGDKDQLASVEAGAVLGDLCLKADQVNYHPDTANWIKSVTGYDIPQVFQNADGDDLSQAITMLRHSHRFRSDGGIGALAMLVNEQQIQAPSGQKQHSTQPLNDLKQLFMQEESTDRPVLRLIKAEHSQASALQEIFKGYHHYLDLLHKGRPETSDPEQQDQWAWQVLRAYSDFQILTALRQGDWGIEGLNDNVRQILVQQGKLARTDAIWYEGRPVLVTRNNYSLKLMNGDVGIALMVEQPDAGKEGKAGIEGRAGKVLRVAFPADDGSETVRWVMPGRLQDVETVFAMTVHKSQGSEFRHTALILPERSNPVLTRELLYTGITRSREQFSLICSREEVLEEAMKLSVYRVSGITSMNE